MANITISMPDKLKAYVDEQMEKHGYGNVSEYFRHLLREDHKRQADAELERLLIEGLESGGPDIPYDETFWDRVREKAKRLADERKPA